ncbi:MAG: intracellular septation protein A [uncultured bacterium]|nr:MAG: intracellular septation protein A [uncultured bacterium]OGT26638.1 MAG: septation protein A [Gammaproteobacteria bacterium RIFCSPHIGHO2_02_FULL_42_43]OGT29465.1 MAG: septation protein A [Gammaproteobacteria bacterium RIFCSPHIGHO2_01_FULL_42_8]OGT53056.1 MAG: septation protein A [Gammaproteobacteria bacterium RIFCSPHIGHO2_12_FULL_41_25]OGT61170.1 MAG: septation protein A [Gammaproteobacteria bacterium RIFCSPLOWO2_02_FULL_42_14]OGT87097.1 MAG: septation protein A [Gammaproteobacteria bac
MKFLFDYFPIICFFIAYKFWGVYVATAVAIGACVLQNIFYWIRHRRFEKMHVLVLISVAVLGGLTLFFHNAIFIKWKVSIVYWIFAGILLFNQYVSKKNILQKMLGDKIALSELVWKKLTVAWSVFFIFLGFLNMYVMYHYSTNTWVYFKLFGTLGLTIVFVIAQAVYMSRHMKLELENN